MCSRLLPSVASHGGWWRGEGSSWGEPPSGHPSDLTNPSRACGGSATRRVTDGKRLTKARGRNSASRHPEGMAKIVDIGRKPDVHRRAVATGSIRLRPPTVRAIRDGRIEKGDVLASAEVA